MHPKTTTRDLQAWWFGDHSWADGVRWASGSLPPEAKARLQAARQELFGAAVAHVRATIPESEARMQLAGSVGVGSDMDPTFMRPRTLEANRLFREGMEAALRPRGLPTDSWMERLGRLFENDATNLPPTGGMPTAVASGPVLPPPALGSFGAGGQGNAGALPFIGPPAGSVGPPRAPLGPPPGWGSPGPLAPPPGFGDPVAPVGPPRPGGGRS